MSASGAKASSEARKTDLAVRVVAPPAPCPPPWRGTPGRVRGELSKVLSCLRGRNVGAPLLIALNCVAANIGLRRLVDLHDGKCAAARGRVQPNNLLFGSSWPMRMIV
jgi:hypothetical protein